MENYIMGIDIGTTGSKAMVVTLDGVILGSGYREYSHSLLYPEPNACEMSASGLMDEVCDTIADAIADSGVDSADIAAISFSVQRCTFTLLDEDYEPIRDMFYVWTDSRAESVIEDIHQCMDPDYMFSITGMPVTRTFSVEKLFWIKKQQPEIYKKARHFALVDAYAMWYFGADQFCTETTNATASGMIDVRTLEWNTEVIDALELRMDLLPPLVPPASVVGRVKKEISRRTGLKEGTLIVAGSGDQQAASMGAGIIEDGSMSLTLGTVCELAVGLAKPEFAKMKNLMVPCTPVLGVFEIEGNQVSGATCYRWARDTICTAEVALGEAMGVDPYNLMEHYINKSVPGANGVIFLAGLFGTGYPTQNAEATGAYVGLKYSTTRADMLRAVIEGVTLESRFMYESIKALGVQTKDCLTITGGATKSPAWCQTIADIMGLTLYTLEVSEASIIGVATLAAIGAGLLKDTREGVARMVRLKDEITPIPENVAIYDKIYPVYRDTYYALNNAGIYLKLAGI